MWYLIYLISLLLPDMIIHCLMLWRFWVIDGSLETICQPINMTSINSQLIRKWNSLLIYLSRYWLNKSKYVQLLSAQTMLYGRLSLYSHFVINVLYISFLPEYACLRRTNSITTLRMQHLSLSHELLVAKYYSSLCDDKSSWCSVFFCVVHSQQVEILIFINKYVIYNYAGSDASGEDYQTWRSLWVAY